jgi:hypothetical protein
MHFLIYNEQQPNSYMNATCFYGSDDTLHDKSPSCVKSPPQINHNTLVSKEVIRGKYSWPFTGSFKPSVPLDKIIFLKGNPLTMKGTNKMRLYRLIYYS